MQKRKTLNVPLNRVEGDLEVHIDLQDGVVTDARASGVLYRGFEQALIGRGSLDGLVITPRVCGICATAHTYAAARALDMIAGVPIPPKATKIRNLAMMAEYLQSDLRHTVLMFAADFTNPAYRDSLLFSEAIRRYEPLKGTTVVETIRRTRELTDVLAILGGQWPHSSLMVPGGIMTAPADSDIIQCRHKLKRFRIWYEERILGCSLDRWRDVCSADDLQEWLEESESHRESELGFFLRFALRHGLNRIGAGYRNFISYGSLPLPEGTAVRSRSAGEALIPAGVSTVSGVEEFDQDHIREYVTHAWYEEQEGGLHPSKGKTLPYASGNEGDRYSWAKSPRYRELPMETGPLAEMVVGGAPLLTDIIDKQGPSVMARQLARIIRAAELFPAMETWLEEVTREGIFYESPGEIRDGAGFGLVEASRGALGHWVRIREARIVHYQLIPPTTWNASPRDASGSRGPMEEALVGTQVKDAGNPIEVEHIVRSFDPCLVCTVH